MSRFIFKKSSNLKQSQELGNFKILKDQKQQLYPLTIPKIVVRRYAVFFGAIIIIDFFCF